MNTTDIDKIKKLLKEKGGAKLTNSLGCKFSEHLRANGWRGVESCHETGEAYEKGRHYISLHFTCGTNARNPVACYVSYLKRKVNPDMYRRIIARLEDHIARYERQNEIDKAKGERGWSTAIEKRELAKAREDLILHEKWQLEDEAIKS